MQKKKKFRRLLLPAVLVCLMAAAGWDSAAPRQPEPAYPEDSGHAQPGTARDPDTGPVFLYFADPQTGYLSAEPRDMERRHDIAGFCKQLVQALLAGPESGRMPVFPPETKLRALYAAPGATVYVDLSGDFAARHPKGVRSELLSVFGIVNTILLNTDRVRAVQILIDGRQSGTLAGHIDISRPHTAQMLLVR